MRILVAVAAVTCLIGETIWAAGQTAGRPAQAILVRMVNQAEAPAKVVGLAEQETTRHFATIGLSVTWLASAAEPDVPHLTVTLLDERVGSTLPIPATMVGATPRPENGRGNRAYVIYDRVRDWADRDHLDVARVLAAMMSHEMGHMLLPAPAHAPSGLMKATFNRTDLLVIGSGQLAFSPETARRMLGHVEHGPALSAGLWSEGQQAAR
jgi:hypothetical protein